jgi:hypothetical protein
MSKKPKRDKKDKKDKKKKKKLTDKQLLKLLKALKPQTQQIVRVNVGDDKKKVVPSSITSAPFVFPSQIPAIINQGQAPAPTAASWSPLPMSQQPQLQPLIMPPSSMPPPQEPRLLTDVESDIENIKVRRSKKREEEARLGYSVKEAREPRFKPKQMNETKLAQESSISNRITELPSSNDPYMPYEIQTTAANDQMGNVSGFGLSSDQWVLTPEGVLEDILVPVTQKEEPISAAEVFNEPLTQETEETEEIVVQPQKMSKESKREKKQIIQDLEDAIVSGEIDKTDIPSDFFEMKEGKEQIRKSTKLALLKPYWIDLKVMRGSAFL